VLTAPILAGMVALAALSTPAAITSPPDAVAVPLRIDCAVLDRESRGALEARARAEIAVSPEPAGTATVVCDARSARVEWLAAGAAARQRVVAFDPSRPAQTVDALLDAIHELRLGTDRALAPPPAPVAPGASGPTAVELGVAVAGEPPPRRVRFGILAAARGQLWSGSIAGAIEGELGGRLASNGGWSLTATGTLGRGLETPQSIQASTLGARLGVGRTLDGKLELALGGAWLRLLATRSSGAPVDHLQSHTFGAFASVRYVLARGPFGFAVGPDLTALTAPVAVDVTGSELFRIPRFVAGLSVAGTADVVR
jgi:hypothetical protein